MYLYICAAAAFKQTFPHEDDDDHDDDDEDDVVASSVCFAF